MNLEENPTLSASFHCQALHLPDKVVIGRAPLHLEWTTGKPTAREKCSQGKPEAGISVNLNFVLRG